MEVEVKDPMDHKGDKNFKFFYHSTIIRRHKNQIQSLSDASKTLFIDKEAISQKILHFFRSLWIANIEGSGPFSYPHLVP